ncbi:MAG: cell division protein ZapA [Gemmatimonadetes bacterium]|nr:cell division protein ZapA [Gemmatimonadota bacterium]
MSTIKHSTRVTICGEDYNIRSDSPPDHTRAVAAYVDGKIREVLENASVVESHKAAILAALQITDELFEAKQAQADAADAMRTLSGELKRWLPPGKRTPSA